MWLCRALDGLWDALRLGWWGGWRYRHGRTVWHRVDEDPGHHFIVEDRSAWTHTRPLRVRHSAPMQAVRDVKIKARRHLLGGGNGVLMRAQGVAAVSVRWMTAYAASHGQRRVLAAVARLGNHGSGRYPSPAWWLSAQAEGTHAAPSSAGPVPSLNR